jgi:3-methyladenine DNA glycosylase/8-oxoguanine DNA glycosylase
MIREFWQLSRPFQLAETLRMTVPRSPALLRLDAAQASYTLWTETGPATVLLTHAGDELRAEASGPGAAAAVVVVPRTVGLDDDPKDFKAGSGLIRDLQRRHRGLRLGSTGRIFDTVVRTVIGQRVTTDEARRSYARLVEMAGERAPGDSGMLLPPLPVAILRLDQGAFHRAGIEHARARVIRAAARAASRLEQITAMDEGAARTRLEALPGIGVWTSAQVMGAAWGDRDAVPFGDFHLPNTVAWALAGEPRGTDERMAELLEPYRPQRRRALLLMKISGVHAPRFGPRSAHSVISRNL